MSLPAVVRLLNGQKIPIASIPESDIADFREAVLVNIENGAHLSACFGQPLADSAIKLWAVLTCPPQGNVALFTSRVMHSYPALTPDCPQAHLFERELAEQYGIVPEGHPWLKPVRQHNPSNDASIDFYRVEGEEVHEVAVGPVHAGIIEPGHFRFQFHR